MECSFLFAEASVGVGKIVDYVNLFLFERHIAKLVLCTRAIAVVRSLSSSGHCGLGGPWTSHGVDSDCGSVDFLEGCSRRVSVG
jgi:hypothetical protein